MSDYGTSDISTTPLGANQFPISDVYVPNVGLTATEGGPVFTDAGGKKSSSTSMYIKDGSNVTQGAQADAAYTDGTGAASGTGMGLFKGIFVKLAAIATAIAGTLKVKGDFTEVAGQGTGVVNAQNTDLIPSTDVSAYKWFSLQIAGTFSLTLTVQVSNDNTNWQAVRVQNTLAQVVNFDTLTLAGTYDAPIKSRFLRVRATSFTSNTSLVGTLELYTSPAAMNVQVATQGGTWTVQPGNTANTTPWLVSTAQIAGTATSVNAGNRDAGTQRIIESGNPTPTVTQVTSAASDTSILAANANKKGTLFFNDSTATLYLLYGTGAASLTNYSVQIQPKGFFEDPLHYTGGFHGIWSAVSGFVYCTEVS